MDEYLLHYIWTSRYYHSGNLSTTDGQLLEIINSGRANTDQGPDFLFAKIRIDGTILVGHVEIHVRSSDWLVHGHTGDPHYNNVILHVVWKDNKRVLLPFPTLELEPRISKMALTHYRHLKQTKGFISCEKLFKKNMEDVFLKFGPHLTEKRLEERSCKLLNELETIKGNWERLAWRKLAHYLGGVKNGEAMETLFDSVSSQVIQSCSLDRTKTEALFFGQACMLSPDCEDAYSRSLMKEYEFLKKKHKLTQPRIHWMFLRMRPYSFPTIKIARFAALIHSAPKIMSHILSEDNPAKIRLLFDKPLSPYWEEHVRFGHATSRISAYPGNQTLDNLMINLISPMLYAYGTYHNVPVFKERAMKLLSLTKAEVNSVTKKMKSIGFPNRSASESQAIIQLYTQYCIPKKCLSCDVGFSIFHPERLSGPFVSDDGF